MKYKNALKRLQGEMGEAAPPRIPIPKLSRIEHYINLVEAWRQVDVSDLHTLLPDVKVVPYELAERTGWTPENAFVPFNAIIEQEQHQDAVAQAVSGAPVSALCTSQSQINPNNKTQAPTKRYRCMVSGCKTRASFGSPGQLPSYCNAHKQENSINVIGAGARPTTYTKPKPARKQSTLVSFLSPPSQFMSQPKHSNKAPPLPLSPEFVKCARTQTLSDSEETESDSPSLIPPGSALLAREQMKPSSVCFNSDTESDSPKYPNNAIISERNQLEVAIEMSLKTEPVTPNTPKITKKEPVQQRISFGFASTSPMTRLRAKGINSALGETKRALARGNLGESEMSHLQATMKKHRLFMLADEVKEQLAYFFTPPQISALNVFLQEDPKSGTFGESFRNYDLRCLLSTSYISDPVLEVFQHTLQVAQDDVYFVPPTLFKYLQDFDRSGKRLFEGCDFNRAKFVFWSCNISNWHWTCAVHANKPGATVYFMDTLLGGNNMPRDLVTQCEKLTAAAVPPYKLNSRAVRLEVPPQSGDDCGACVNHIALNMALHGREFLSDTSSTSFDTVNMRISQLKAIWEHVLTPCTEAAVITPLPCMNKGLKSPDY